MKNYNMGKTLYIRHNNKSYPVILTDEPNNEYDTIHIYCKGAGLDQWIMREDLDEFLDTIPELIEIKKDVDRELWIKDEVFHMRLTSKEKELLKKNAKKRWYSSISSFIRAVTLSIK
jgi:hypothetical protein